MEMKKLLYTGLNSIKTSLHVTTVLTGGQSIIAPATPFIVIRVGDKLPTPSKDNNGGSHGVEIWVHDTIGGYERIDDILERVRIWLNQTLPVSGERGSIISQAVWVNDSPELKDDGYHTICRMSNYKLIGVDRIPEV